MKKIYKLPHVISKLERVLSTIQPGAAVFIIGFLSGAKVVQKFISLQSQMFGKSDPSNSVTSATASITHSVSGVISIICSSTYDERNDFEDNMSSSSLPHLMILFPFRKAMTPFQLTGKEVFNRYIINPNTIIIINPAAHIKGRKEDIQEANSLWLARTILKYIYFMTQISKSEKRKVDLQCYRDGMRLNDKVLVNQTQDVSEMSTNNSIFRSRL